MIDGSEKRNCQLAFELRNSHVCEKRSNTAKFFDPLVTVLKGIPLHLLYFAVLFKSSFTVYASFYFIVNVKVLFFRWGI